MSRLPIAAKIFVVLTVLAGTAVLFYGSVHLKPANPLQFFLFLALAVAASRLKVKLPGMNGSMSVNLPFFLIVVAKLSISEALVIACVSTIAQSLARSPSRNRPVQMVFNPATLLNAVALAAMAFSAALQYHLALPLAVIAAAIAYFLGNTVPMALILWLAEGEKPVATWSRMADLTFPYYLLSASLTAIVCCGVRDVGWTIPFVLFVIMYLTYRSYRLYFARAAAGPKPAPNATKG